MRRFVITALVLVGASASLVCAQDPSMLIRQADNSYQHARSNIEKSAEWMPEWNYGFRPTARSRTFGQIIRTAAIGQFTVCSAIEGKRWDGNISGTSKADLVKALKQSNGVCDSAYRHVTSYTAGEIVRIGTIWNRSKLGLLFLNATHDHELYGELSVYLRLKDILPPSDQAQIVPLD